MKLAAALILPALIVLGIATFETRVLLNPGWSNKPTQGIVWDNQTFTTRAEFARWLRSRGTSYPVWARQHPSFTGVEPSREAQPRTKQPRAKVEGARQKRAFWSLERVAGAAAILALVGLGIVFVRRRRRPRTDQSPVSTVVAAVSTLRTWLPRPVAEAVEESPWEAAAVVAMLPLLVYVGLLLIQA